MKDDTPTQDPVQLLKSSLEYFRNEADQIFESAQRPEMPIEVRTGLIAKGNMLDKVCKAIEALSATENAGWHYGHIDTAPKEEQLIAILRGCDTGVIRYAIIEWSQYGWLFDGSEISNAWDIIGWKVLDLPTPPTKKEG